VTHADRVIRLGLLAAHEAWHDAELIAKQINPARMGCIFGTSKGGLHTLDSVLDHGATDAPWLTGWPSAAAAAISQQFELDGPCIAPVAACATGVAAIVRGVASIESGECDVVVAGSADDSLHVGVLASFQRLGVLSRGDDPTSACRPFDRSRSGFVVGAGAAGVVLERRSHAEARGVRWYAEVIRGRLGTDPSGMTQLDADGGSLIHLIEQTSAGAIPDLVQLHGTGTRANDPAECRAVRHAFGNAATTMCVSGLKGALGHLLGAAGSVETALACLSLRDQIVPPCANLTHVDPACDLNFVRDRTITARVEMVLKLSLGFGGHQAAVLLRRGNRASSPIAEAIRPVSPS
jgi:3-oxoacyl-[acyl-carrier-protein] synthase II